MNELLGVFTAFGVMLGGNRVLGPIPCDKEITRSVETYVLKDEGGKLGESISCERRQQAANTFTIIYQIRRFDGSTSAHAYQVESTQDCKRVVVKRINT